MSYNEDQSASPQDSGDGQNELDDHATEDLSGASEPRHAEPPSENAVDEEALVSPSRRWRRTTVLVAVAVLLAAVVGGVLATTGSSPNADAAVISAVNQALANNSASVSMTEQGSVGTESVNFSGTGGINFADNTFEVNVTGTVGGQNLEADVRYIGGSIYEGTPELSLLAPGKSWLSLNVSSLANASQTTDTSALGTDPLSTLRTLAQKGNVVTALGSSTVDGQSVEGYSVTFSQSTLKKELNSATLPSWMRTATSQGSLLSGSEKVFINGNTLVQVGIATADTTAIGTVTTNESVEFSDYGTTENISVPPSSETIPFAQFLKLASATPS